MSDFNCTIIVAKQINNNNFIVVAIESLEKKSLQVKTIF